MDAAPAALRAIRVYGTSTCGDCLVARRILDTFDLEYDWIDITGDPAAIAFVQSVNHGYRSVPTILFPDGGTLTEPSGRDLRGRLVAMGYSPREASRG